jgi:YjbE family integral membrane protein
MTSLVTADALTALFQVVLIDLVLAGDNAVVIGLAAAGLPAEQRGRAILVGIIAATGLRIAFATVAAELLQLLGLLLAGGVLLLWVSWKMWRELRARPDAPGSGKPLLSHSGAGSRVSEQMPRKTFGQAATQIVVADISMSLDNVLAVAGAAREHPFILGFGLLLSVALMGIAANLLGRLLQRQPWISYLGLAIIIFVACEMIYRGAQELAPVLAPVLAQAQWRH